MGFLLPCGRQRDNRVIRGQVGLVAFDRVVSSLLWIVWWDVMARS